MKQLSIWHNKRTRFFQFQYHFLKPTQHDYNTNPNKVTTSPSVKKLHHQTYQLFLENKKLFINKKLPKFVPPSPNLEVSTLPAPIFVQQTPPLYIIQTVNSNDCINSFSCPSDNFFTEIFYLLRPHIELSPNTDPFVILNHIFDTYRNLQFLLQLRSTDIRYLILSTNHVDDFLKRLVLLETPPKPPILPKLFSFYLQFFRFMSNLILQFSLFLLKPKKNLSKIYCFQFFAFSNIFPAYPSSIIALSFTSSFLQNATFFYYPIVYMTSVK